MTTTTKYIDPTEPTYTWTDWEIGRDRPSFSPSSDGSDLMLLSVLGIACTYEVWAVGYADGVLSRIVVTISGEGAPGYGGGVVREWTFPQLEKWDHRHAWVDTLLPLAMRWTLNHALLEIRKESLVYPTATTEASTPATSDDRLVL